MTIVTLGLDLGKNWIHMVGFDGDGSIVLRRRVRRHQLPALTANMPACLIGMEACSGAHHLARTLQAQGHEPRLMPPQYVKPFVKANKNDYRDAEATVESLSPHRVLPVEDDPNVLRALLGEEGDIPPAPAQLPDETDFAQIVYENLKASGVQNTKKGERLEFIWLKPFASKRGYIQFEGRYQEDGEEKRAAISIGPEYGTVGYGLVRNVAREAADLFDTLVICGFAFAPEVDDSRLNLGNLTVLKAHMNQDLRMGDKLKNTGAANLFVVLGEPDIAVEDVGEAFRREAEKLFESDLRGRYCRIGLYDDGGEVNIVVTHGAPLKTTEVIAAGSDRVISFREAEHAVVTYSAATGRLIVGGFAKSRRAQLAEIFAKTMLKRPRFFANPDAQNLYTLVPVERAGFGFTFQHAYDPAIQRVQIVEVQADRVGIDPRSGETRTFWSHVTRDSRDNALARLGEATRGIAFGSGWRLNHLVIRLQIDTGASRPARVTVKLKPPGTAMFKRHRFEDRIMTLLRRNGLAHDREFAPPAIAAQ
jgi:hypothetical protein